MAYKITLKYDPSLWQKVPGGNSYGGHPLADGDNETLPSYIDLIQALQLALAELQASQPNLQRGDNNGDNTKGGKAGK
jgi:hypothetical protein